MIKNKSNSKIQDFLPLICILLFFPKADFCVCDSQKNSASNDTKYVNISIFSTLDIFFFDQMTRLPCQSPDIIPILASLDEFTYQRYESVCVTLQTVSDLPVQYYEYIV